MRPAGDNGDERTSGGELLEVYRTLPARLLGWLMVVVTVTLGILVVRSELSLDHDVVFPLAAVCFVMAMTWTLLLRPRVELRSASVTQRNIVRDVEVPFDRLAEIGSTWALELTDTAGRTYSSWAIPKQREFSARRAFDDFSETTTRRTARPGTTAQVVAGDTERVWHRWQMDGGVVLPYEPAYRTWALGAVIPLLASTALLALAILLQNG